MLHQRLRAQAAHFQRPRDIALRCRDCRHCRRNRSLRREFPCCRACEARSRKETKIRRRVSHAETRPPAQARASSRSLCSFGGGVSLELGQLRIHRVPYRRVRGPNFVLRFINVWIVERASRDTLPEVALAAEQSGAALRTKAADVLAHHFAPCAVILRRSLRNPESVRRSITAQGAK